MQFGAYDLTTALVDASRFGVWHEAQFKNIEWSALLSILDARYGGGLSNDLDGGASGTVYGLGDLDLEGGSSA